MPSRRDEEVRRARELLLERGIRAAALPPSLVPEEIEQSWRRSVSLRVDPSAEPRTLGIVDPDATVLRAAGRIMDQWQGSLADSRLALLLADQDGRIVSRRIIAPQDEKRLDRANAAEGFDFSEGSLGTNGLGTPIESRGVVFVRGTEHYNEALAQLACAGAPLRHPITGRIVGSLALASPARDAHPLMVAMVRQAGQQIAEQLVAQADSRDLELARTYQRYRSSRRPVLVMNTGTVMTDLPTLSHLDTETHAVLWDQLQRHHWSEETLRLELPLLGTTATARRLGRTPQEPLFVLEFTDPLELQLPPGVLIDEARPDLDMPSSGGHVAGSDVRGIGTSSRDVIDSPVGDGIDPRGDSGDPGADAAGTDPVANSAGTRSGLRGTVPAGHSTGRAGASGAADVGAALDPYAGVRRAMDAAAQGSALVEVVGGPGAGKHHQSTRWLRDRTGREPLTLDAGQLTGPEAATGTARQSIIDALSGGRGVIIRRAELLGSDIRGRAAELAGAAVGNSDARLVLAQLIGDADAVSDFRTVVVPNLNALGGGLPAVIRQVTGELFPGAATLRFSPTALQGLLAWHWPGNVTELRQVLAGIPDAARRGLIQVWDLPEVLRQAGGPGLSRYEQSEREAILSALREAGWNKSRAAEILGIGRTTLYRKVRSLKISEGE